MPRGKFALPSIVAVLLLSVTIPVVTKIIKEDSITTLSQKQIKPGTDKAVLTLNDGKQIALENNKETKTDNATSNGTSIIYNKAKVKNALHYNTLEIPRGGRFFVTLSDGTKVWLNSETKIKYPVKFAKNKPREVELLYGEAYFDVTSSKVNNNNSFSVITNGQKINVLGTEFNVKAYKEEQNYYTTLVEGKVVVSSEEKTKTLIPGKQAIYNINTKNIAIKPIDVTYEIAWKNGYFIFRKESLESILKTLSRWYNLKITYENEKAKDEVFSGVLKRTDNASDLLLNLEKTGDVTFKLNKNEIIVK